MTIYLPYNVNLFRRAFDETCDRILRSEQDAIFYALFVQFVVILREHPLLKDCIAQLEVESAKRKKELNEASLEALEDRWKRLWKYHRKSLKHRKQLVDIKRIVTAPNVISYSPLYHRILFSMWEFCYFSPLFRFMNEAPVIARRAFSEIRFGCLHSKQYSSLKEMIFVRKGALSTLTKRNGKDALYTKILKTVTGPKLSQYFKWPVERLPTALFSQKLEEIEQKFLFIGQNNDEKRLNMQIMAETSFVFCWDKIRFLEKCYTMEDNFPFQKPIKGKWVVIRKLAWQIALKRCEIEVLLGTKMAWGQKLSSEPSSSTVDAFLMCEHQIHRRDYEKYLRSLVNHVHALLFRVETMEQKVGTNPRHELPGTQKESFVIDLASKYWKAYPQAKYDDVFVDYSINCPATKLLSRPRWEQIIRKHKLDPRSKDAKKRGPGKKTSQI